VSNAAQLKKIAAIHEELSELKHIVVMDEIEATISFAQLERSGIEYSNANPTTYEATWPAAEAERHRDHYLHQRHDRCSQRRDAFASQHHRKRRSDW
jgi:hypothetical protein